ncbi:beta-ketoacyl-[acyl-carrier-protein] synthase family protein [Kibdelosporangium aridum]|uniref:Beta-ketoacyl-[acyl-carrier-protein] synthase family protein n=1 Tax=Kibdelosporangium aridum TaxID=2030 RepID=A0A428Z310_KIBAR|nr:beta-ketoacyl-[acyl-carrier-protein] synthase family protein [Kibdelosporangium aridum]
MTGAGLVTSAGIGVPEAWQRICKGAGTAASAVPALAGTPADFGCQAADFDPIPTLGKRKAWRLDRSSQFAVAAAVEAVGDAGLTASDWSAPRVGVVLGNGIGGAATWEKQHRTLLEEGPKQVSGMLIPMLSINMSAGYVAMHLGVTGPNFVTATACASGTTAIGMARELLRSNACDVVITGGTEACLVPSIVAGFSQMGALSKNADIERASRPFDAERDGFVAAEGAAVLVLERVEDAVARNARIYARVTGYGASADAHHATAPDPEGAGAELALRSALRDANIGPADVQHVNAHGTSTPLNDMVESRMIQRVLGDRPAVTSIKGVVGHALGAAGAIEAVATALSLHHSVIPPTANLTKQDPEVDLDIVAGAPRSAPIDVAVSNSFGFGGQNAVLVLGKA